MCDMECYLSMVDEGPPCVGCGEKEQRTKRKYYKNRTIQKNRQQRRAYRQYPPFFSPPHTGGSLIHWPWRGDNNTLQNYTVPHWTPGFARFKAELTHI